MNGKYLGPDTGDRVFAADLRARAAAAGFTSAVLAARIDVDPSMIKKWLCDHDRPQLPSKEMWHKLSDLLPGLYRPERFNALERGVSGAGIGSRVERRVTLFEEKRIAVIEGRRYDYANIKGTWYEPLIEFFEGEETSAEAAQ